MKILFLILCMSLLSMAEHFHFIDDGKLAYCPPTLKQKESQLKKVLKMKLVDKRIDANTTHLTIEISYVKCQDNNWIVDTNPGLESFHYLLPDNSPVTINVKYSDFKIMILDENGQEIKTLRMKEILNSGKENFSFRISTKNYQSVELAPSVKRSFYVNETFHSSDMIFFGSYRFSRYR